MKQKHLLQFCSLLFLCLEYHVESKKKLNDDENGLPSFREIASGLGAFGTQKELWVIGTYMAAHKYFAVDFRYQAGDVQPEDRVFYKKFPSPILKEFDPKVVAACDKGSMSCVREVYRKAWKSGTLQHLTGINRNNNDTVAPFAPFKSEYEQFKYRQTAAYYLCWYSLREDQYMKYTAESMKNQTCFSYLHAVEEIPKPTRNKLIKDKTPAIIDVRDSQSFPKWSPFTCPQLWFCPDPCFGKKDGGNFRVKSGHVAGNPCKGLNNEWCSWKPGANTNFRDLIRNKFNVTCDCESSRTGFEFENQFGICVDKDECFDGKADCPSNRICKNSVGSYICTCPRGYHADSERDNCEAINTLHSSAKLLKYKPDIQKDEDFLSELMDWVGLSGGSTIRLSFGKILIICIMCICI